MSAFQLYQFEHSVSLNNKRDFRTKNVVHFTD